MKHIKIPNRNEFVPYTLEEASGSGGDAWLLGKWLGGMVVFLFLFILFGSTRFAALGLFRFCEVYVFLFASHSPSRPPNNPHMTTRRRPFDDLFDDHYRAEWMNAREPLPSSAHVTPPRGL